jgi:hypothetical protein
MALAVIAMMWECARREPLMDRVVFGDEDSGA